MAHDLLVVGELNPDLIMRGDVIPRFGQREQVVDDARLVLGSSGAIVACGAARLGLSVAYAGLVGDDALGRLVLAALAERGVDTAHVGVRAGGSTGLSCVLSPEAGRRGILTHLGVMADLRADEVPDAALAQARHLHVSSPFLQTALRPGLAGLLRRARAHGASTSLDPNWDPSGAWDLDDLLGELDLLVPNEAEALALARTDDVNAAAEALAARGPLVAVKRGALGALAHDGHRVTAVGAPGGEVVDSTGAGDSFDAALLAAWLEGAELRDGLRLAVAAGTLSLRRVGGTAGQATRAEAEALAARVEPAPPTAPATAPSLTARELASQPQMWLRTAEVHSRRATDLPSPGTRVLAVGAGTSFYVLEAWARRRQELDGTITRAQIASELDERGSYDLVVALSRSGTSSDTLAALAQIAGRAPVLALCGVAGSPVDEAADATILLDFADEGSVVQTRFATTALALLRRGLGEDLTAVIAQAEGALAEPLVVEPDDAAHLVFLGAGWSVGLAQEAALKCREAARLHTEAYAVGEYQHGPIAVAGPQTTVWSLAPVHRSLAANIQATGARLHVARRDPMAELVAVHRVAEAAARARGLDPDRPAHLARSVVLG